MDIKTRFEDLSPACLDVLLPKTPDFDAANVLRNGSPEALSQVPMRRNLFFDEQANVFVILRTARPEEEVREVLPHLEFVLAAHATDAVPQGSGNAASASGKHDLNSKSFPAASFASVLSLEDTTYIIWKPILHLARPRARLQRPAIYFTVALTISNNVQKGPRQTQEEYLKSYEPLPVNILEPLQFDPALSRSNVYLPESRITKVAPKAPNLQDAVKPIRGASKRAFPAIPAIFSRIRYTVLADATIASLHLETSHVIAGTVTISDVKLSVPNAKVEHLTNVALPLETRGGDETITLYRLTLGKMAKGAASQRMSPVSVSILANASLDQGSHITFNSSWNTQVDLSQTSTKPVYKWSRPLSTSSGHRRGHSSSSHPGPVSFEEPQRRMEEDAGITFRFSAPATTHKSTNFQLEVHCNNHSGRKRRFALISILPSRPKSMTAQSTVANTDLIASIFNAPPLEKAKLPDVLDLNPDVRIGPLPSGACFETHLKFRAMTTGVLDLGTLRIVDLDSRHTVDVKELPNIVALD
ncbi:hypothetical protein AC578_6057 [Lecanosticta acicola]|uniref:Trafficking protein particle complex II-specific subunit 65 IgD3 domain-containing protein n=1 Tax=Lecanosticta acicola TaxID=111012 RepID=A0AAI8YWU9_9PEZI|nr:hypothetical protein AC578_6057 [Lecanosticta acicola]